MPNVTVLISTPTDTAKIIGPFLNDEDAAKVLAKAAATVKGDDNALVTEWIVVPRAHLVCAYTNVK